MGTGRAMGPSGWPTKSRVRAMGLTLTTLFLVILVVACRQDGTPNPAQATSTPSPVPWTQLSVFSGQINALLVTDLGGVRTVYVGCEGGVFKSLDAGETWITCNDGLPNRLVRSLVVDPDDSNTLYAGTWNGRLHVTHDGGASWQERSNGLPPYEIQSIAVHTHDPQRLYIGLPKGVFTTTNGGEQWFLAADLPGAATLQCMVMDPERPNYLYVGTPENGVFKSVDGGTSWFSIGKDLKDVSALVIAPQQSTTIYAISEGKVYRTDNEGVLWVYVDSYRDPAITRCLALNPKNLREVYVGLTDGLYKSQDARKTWTRSDAGLLGLSVQIVRVDPLNPKWVYACTGNRLFVSEDGGATWQERGNIQARNSAGILALAGDPKHGDVFYTSTAGGGIFKTIDQGDHWQHVGESLPLSWITSIAVEPVNTQTIYLGIQQGFVFKSPDGGASWLPMGAVTEAAVSTIVIDPEEPLRLYAGTQERGLFRSDDGGALWVPKGPGIGKSIQRIAIDPRGTITRLYVLTEIGVFRSEDNGESWSPYSSPVADLIAAIKDKPDPLVVTRTDMNFVTGQGISEAITVIQSSSISMGSQIESLSMSPAAPQTLYALASQRGVFRSADQGTSWSFLGPGLEGRDLRALALSPDDSNLVLVGTDQGIFRYRVAGQP